MPDKKEKQFVDLWFTPRDGKYGPYWEGQQCLVPYAYKMEESGKLKVRMIVESRQRGNNEKPTGAYKPYNGTKYQGQNEKVYQKPKDEMFDEVPPNEAPWE